METKGFFSIWSHYKCLSYFRFNWIPMLWIHSHYKYCNSSSARTVFRRQNLTLKSVPALKWRRDRIRRQNLTSYRIRRQNLTSYQIRCQNLTSYPIPALIWLILRYNNSILYTNAIVQREFVVFIHEMTFDLATHSLNILIMCWSGRVIIYCKHEALNQYRINAGPPSTTLDQHQNSIVLLWGIVYVTLGNTLIITMHVVLVHLTKGNFALVLLCPWLEVCASSDKPNDVLLAAFSVGTFFIKLWALFLMDLTLWALFALRLTLNWGIYFWWTG